MDLFATFRLTIKLAVVAIMLAVVAQAGSGEVSAATTTVNVGDFWFCNSSFSGTVCPTRIAAGDTVTWNWVGGASHTTTACSDGTFTTCGAAQGWDSGSMSTGTFSHTFNSAGTFFYHCHTHPAPMRRGIHALQDPVGDGWLDVAQGII